ncbi:MAG: hypothetical protein COV75_03155 [Candidatus Omnitrophica bacterium CG11_big_fil_rev_8_21_14_0_20_63_9]|nr:MAG: hypothetical protein COV75_03155 [Candidatus Omnitrophica bacterium CG11_big_fil_rev_8_21_14_0_20_63_9]
MSWRIRIANTTDLLAQRASMARSILSRMVGLLNRSGLADGEGLILPRCRAIHTWFMRFPIDAVFVDRQWQVVAVHKALGPWRMTPCVWGAQAVIELPAGQADRARLGVGAQLVLEPLEGQKILTPG